MPSLFAMPSESWISISSSVKDVLEIKSTTKSKSFVLPMEANKSKNFYTLRTMQNKMLKAKIKNLEVLGAVFERADKDE